MTKNRSVKRYLRKNCFPPSRSRSTNPARNERNHIETIGHVANIALAIVAIFGYFYTVQPTYQKERLAEQVADYEGIIKKQTPKIAAIEAQLEELQQERFRLGEAIEKDRTRLTNELKHVERQLASARAEKDRVESQIKYMAYRYKLPDGTPAVTDEQVRTAQVYEGRRGFFNALGWACAERLSGPFSSYSIIQSNEKDASWPFSEREMNDWKKYGERFPLENTLACINATSADYAAKRVRGMADEVESWRKLAITYANEQATAKPWKSPVDPTDVLQQLAKTRASSDAILNTDLSKIELEEGDWESTIGEARRAIAKHNYGVSKLNARNRHLSRGYEAESQAQQKARELRKSISEEAKRLVLADQQVAK